MIILLRNRLFFLKLGIPTSAGSIGPNIGNFGYLNGMRISSDKPLTMCAVSLLVYVSIKHVGIHDNNLISL